MVIKVKYPELLLNVLIPFVVIIIILKFIYIDPIVSVNYMLHFLAISAILRAAYSIIKNTIFVFQEIRIDNDSFVISNSLQKKETKINLDRISLVRIKKDTSKTLNFFNVIEIASRDTEENTITLSLSPSMMCDLFNCLSNSLKGNIIDQKSADFVDKINSQTGLIKQIMFYKSRIILLLGLCVFLVFSKSLIYYLSLK
jgi:hypothetical protein